MIYTDSAPNRPRALCRLLETWHNCYTKRHSPVHHLKISRSISDADFVRVNGGEEKGDVERKIGVGGGGGGGGGEGGGRGSDEEVLDRDLVEIEGRLVGLDDEDDDESDGDGEESEEGEKKEEATATTLDGGGGGGRGGGVRVAEGPLVRV